MALSLYNAGSALGLVCPRYADVPIDTTCTFIAFSWISHVLCLRESRTIMVDKGTGIVLRRSTRSGEHPDFLSAMKDRKRDLSRSVLTVVAIVRHIRTYLFSSGQISTHLVMSDQVSSGNVRSR